MNIVSRPFTGWDLTSEKICVYIINAGWKMSSIIIAKFSGLLTIF